MLGRLHRLVVAFGIGLGLAALAATLFAHRDLLGVDIMEDPQSDHGPRNDRDRALVRPTCTRERVWPSRPADLAHGHGHAGRKRRAGHGSGRESHPLGLGGTASGGLALWADPILDQEHGCRRLDHGLFGHELHVRAHGPSQQLGYLLPRLHAGAVIAESPAPRKRLAVVAGVLLGLSGLSKGPVSYYALLLPCIPAVLATGGWSGARTRWRDLRLALGLGVALSVSWPAAAWLAMPDNFSRMLATEQGAWFVEHTKPFWFYLQFPLMTGVWSLMACAALWPGHARARVEPFLPYWRPVLWTLGCVVLLMLVPEKKDRYLLPVLVRCVSSWAFTWLACCVT